MVMNFWEAQRKAKAKTTLYLGIFIVLTVIASALAEMAMRFFAEDTYGDPDIPYVGLAFLALTFCVAGVNYVNFLKSGGSYVAESVGAEPVDPNTQYSKERQLINIVEEIALATSLPVPPIYILEADEINAFAAGTGPHNAAITVTRGCLNLLNRDELQGVLAHEFGHVYHRDMSVSMRVAAMVMGFFIVTFIGLRLLQFTAFTRRSDSEDRRVANPIAVLAIIFLVAGSITWLFGSILQAMVSRQREYLADASSVQFTRNPLGLADALRKIARYSLSDMPQSGKPFSHLYFNEHETFWSRIFATHPPIEDRIAAIEGRKYEAELPPFHDARD
jgi:heat shock protein HtpX